MKNWIGYLLIIVIFICLGLAPSMKISQFATGYSVDSSTYFLGTKDSNGAFYDYKFTAAALSAFIGASGAGNLQAVTTLGNTTNVQIVCTTPGFSATHAGAGFYITNLSTSAVEAFLGYTGSKAQMSLKDATSPNVGSLACGALTGPHSYLFPNEDGTFVTHSTKDSIVVTGPVNQAGVLRYNSLYVRNNSFYSTFAAGAMSHMDYVSGFSTALSWTTPTATRTINIPDQDGDILLNHGGNSSQSLSGASTMTIAHGLGFTPSRVFITPKTANSGTALIGYYISSLTGLTSTNIVITFASPVTAIVEVDWMAQP